MENQWYNILVSTEHLCEEGRREKFFGTPSHRSAQHDGCSYRLLLRPIMCFCLQYKGRIPQDFFYYNMLLNSINTVGSWVHCQGEESLQRHTQPFQRKILVANIPERSQPLSKSFWSACGVRMLTSSRSLWRADGASMAECVWTFSKSLWSAGVVSMSECMRTSECVRTFTKSLRRGGTVSMAACVRTFSKSMWRAGVVSMTERVRSFFKTLWSAAAVSMAECVRIFYEHTWSARTVCVACVASTTEDFGSHRKKNSALRFVSEYYKDWRKKCGERWMAFLSLV
jgi:hypothetical protein